MQGKGLVAFFLVIMAFVCGYQLLLWFPANKVEKRAVAVAETRCSLEDEVSKLSCVKEAELNYLDSVQNLKAFDIGIREYTYQQLKESQLAMGLDLKGGMSLVLQVELMDLLKHLSKKNKDPQFLASLARAKELQKTDTRDYLSIFKDVWGELGQGKKLAPIFAINETFRDKIDFETSDDDVIRLLREEADGTVNLTFKRLRQRIDKVGVVQPNISLDASRDMIFVELPGIQNPQRAREFVTAGAVLEFWDAYRLSDNNLANAFIQANDALKGVVEEDTTKSDEPVVKAEPIYEYIYAENDSLRLFPVDSILTNDTTATAGDGNRGPIFEYVSLNVSQEGGVANSPVLGYVEDEHRKTVLERLNMPAAKNLFPADVAFKYSGTAYGDDKNLYELYALRTKNRTKPPLEGDRIVNASANTDPQTNRYVVSLRMDNLGSKTWAEMTTEAARNNAAHIAILMDDAVMSCPYVENPITGGNSQISGNFSPQEAGDLADILEVGKLPAAITIVQEDVVGPTLGAENIRRSLTALIIGFALVLLFMILYYSTGGIISIIALITNLFFIFGALASYGTVLTLPGIAGIVLTIGMAVDANVIIYERIREELRAGKNVLTAVRDGFKFSYSAIIDANVTTLLTALVLAYYGLGPIKGFAVVLIIGVICSVFTAVLVGRMLIDWWLSRGNTLRFFTGFSERVLANPTFDFMGKRKIAYMISLSIIGVGIAFMVMRGFDLGVDFKGGTTFRVAFDETPKIDAVRDNLTKTFGSAPVVKRAGNANSLLITTDYLIGETGEETQKAIIAKLHEGIAPVLTNSVTLDEFKLITSPKTNITGSTKVGPTIADDIINSSFKAALFALLLIFAYIAIRFRNWQFSLGAVAALFHDVAVVLALFSILWGIVPWSMEIDQAFIAAILTVIGYSINDTVVVFDRIRETRQALTKRSNKEIFNLAINNTISRTLITSLTTLFVVLILFIFGSGSIKGFAFALVIGIIVGTYSSVFVASPITLDLLSRSEGDLEKGLEKKAKSKAKVEG